MKKTLSYLTILLFVVSPFTTYGQQRMAKQISSAKTEGIKFENINIFSPSEIPKEKLIDKEAFRSLKNVLLLNYNIHPKEIQSSHISIEVPINGNKAKLDLIEVEDKFYSYNLVTNKEERYKPNRESAKHYRGVIRGIEQNSLVAISFFDGDVKGIISYGESNYNIGKLIDTSVFIIYDDKDLINTNKFECGVKDDHFEGYDPNVLNGSGISADAYGTNCVRFYFETEEDMFTTLGSVANVENYVTALYNQVAILYYNEGIDTTISEINVWTSTDPYTANHALPLLSEFQNNTSAINGDLGQLLTFRNINSGWAASFNGLCNSNVDNSLSVSGSLNSTVTNVPTYTWTVMVVTHEFGHLFGSRHTHACVWNGNNTAIDSCSGSTEGSCANPGNPASGGTMMSYCHQIPSVGINFTNGFGPQPGNVLRSNVANAACLTDCDNCVASGTNFDLYMKDKPADTGAEPNPDGVTWTSQDMWIRQNLDGGTTHQNAEYKTATPNGVYVRVRNRGSQTSDCATLKVYWTKASAGLLWPTNFINFFQNVSGSPVLHGDILGTAQIPAIAPGGSTIIELPWFPPNPDDFASDIHHFCLTARIISADDPMANEVNGRIEPNARNNNNIIQKNISVQDIDPDNSPLGLFFRGVERNSEFINVLFTDKGFKGDKIDGSFFERGGTVEVTIDERYFEIMLEYGSLEGEGIKILDKNKVLIYSNKAAFRKVPLKYEESFLLQFKFNLEKIDDKEEVIFDVLQQSAEEEIVQGGERFVFKKSLKEENKTTTTNYDDELQIIPNPNNGSFYLKLSTLKEGVYSIHDFSGTIIQKGKLDISETKINLQKLPRGIYFIKIVSDSKTISKSFIKK